MIDKKKLGIMQGRLSKVYRNKIQSFPFFNWKQEFKLANKIGLKNIEWTIDNYKYKKNPLLTDNGNEEIQYLTDKYKIKIPSVTADFFMEDKYFYYHRINKYSKFFNFLDKCSKNKINLIVIPLVDNSSIKNNKDFLKILIEDFKFLENKLNRLKIQLAFETDLGPKLNLEFMESLNSNIYGINYDIGNSIGYGHNYKTEFKILKKYIKNIHIKNKKKNKTCNLFLGDGNIEKIVNYFLNKGYKKNFIFQTARVKKRHYDIIKIYYKHFSNE